MLGSVDRLHEEFSALLAHLEGQPSLLLTADDSFRKSLLLAATSFFEYQLSACVFDFASEMSGASSLVESLIKRKAIERQYHTWFDWKSPNANSFYSLFGPSFVSFMKARHIAEPWLAESVQSFMELGRSRNLLVHENFASFSLEKTASEIFVAYESASKFVEAIPILLRECSAKAKRPEPVVSSSSHMTDVLQAFRISKFCSS